MPRYVENEDEEAQEVDPSKAIAAALVAALAPLIAEIARTTGAQRQSGAELQQTMAAVVQHLASNGRTPAPAGWRFTVDDRDERGRIRNMTVLPIERVH